MKNTIKYESLSNRLIWIGDDGTEYYIDTMAIEHVFYAARMLYNHAMPPAFQVLRPGEGLNFYQDIKDRPMWEKREAYEVMAAELIRRKKSLPPDMARYFENMKENRAFVRFLAGYPKPLVG